MVIGGLIERYINYSERVKGHSPKTLKSKKNCLLRLERWLDGRDFDLKNTRDYLYYLHDEGNKASSVAQTCKILHGFSHFLLWEEITEKDVLEKLEPPKVEKIQMDVVEPAIAEKVIMAGTTIGKGDRSRSKRLKEEHRQALRLSLRTALRSNELCHIYIKDVCLETGEFTVQTKGGHKEIKTIPHDMLEEFSKRLAEKNRTRLFDVTPETLNAVMKRGCKVLGLKEKLTCHSLRRIFGTSMAMAGAEIATVSRLMGHSKIETTNKFYILAAQKQLGEKLHQYHPLLNASIEFGKKIEMLDNHPLIKLFKNDNSVLFTTEKMADGGYSIVMRPRVE